MPSNGFRDDGEEAPMIMDVIKQGARARTMGRPRDACPYPGDSRERRAWYEGFDGSVWDLDTRVPHPRVMVRVAGLRPDASAPELSAAT
ncbi:Rmf/CrpP family protein [Methylobacterium sp. WL8]|jgi:ribosome modulation factor|uniref:ribosome modulation factor n=2 Tax=unclassified Methylobacterium TaxID=2615210 RepID=UPI0011D9D376|nr:hypothetical protein FV219_05615 [Methylobacterium sp. WL122]